MIQQRSSANLPLLTTVLLTLHGAMRDGFGGAVMACGIFPNNASFCLFDGCQRRFLWIHKEVALAPHPVIGLVLQTGDAEKFPLAFGKTH